MPGKFGRTSRRRLARRRANVNSLISSTESKNTEWSLHRWMCANGYDKRQHYLRTKCFTDTGRGLMALKSLRPGDVVISVPKNLLLTASTVLHSSLGQHIHNCSNCQQVSSHDLLSVFLLIEQHCGPQSVWYYYIRTLPLQYTTPLFWTDAQLRCLPPDVHEEALKQTRTVAEHYHRLSCLLSHYSCRFSLAQFEWAWTSVNSRCVYLSESGTKHCGGDIALVPFLDLLNHSPSVQVSAMNDTEPECFTIKTLSHCHKYDQVFINYGPHCNKRLLVDYGFIVADNPHDCFTINLENMSEAARSVGFCVDLEKKFEIIRHKNLDVGLVVSDEGLSWNLKTALLIISSSAIDSVSLMNLYLQRSVPLGVERKMSILARQLLMTALNNIPSQRSQIFLDSSNCAQLQLAANMCQIYRHILEKCLESLSCPDRTTN